MGVILGGMVEHLPLQIASGILIAALFLALTRLVVRLWIWGDYGLAILLGVSVAVTGGSLVLSGFGTLSF